MVRQASTRTAVPARSARALLASVAVGLISASCTWLPNEFNLSPLYRQRIAGDGTVLEVDVAWPFFHYELTPEGGDDFRIRPFYRRVTEPEQRDFVGKSAVEHQFLWPLGRIRSDDEQQTGRLFPLWWVRERDNDLGMRETDWYLLFPFFWGGSRSDGEESYFGVLPFYADLPNFLAYERLLFVLWPLYTRTERWGRTGHVFLWPLAGVGDGPNGYHWHRFIPLWSSVDDPRYRYRSILWPFIQWGTANLDTPLPIDRWWIWPLIGHQWNAKVTAWSFLWPFFQSIVVEGRSERLDILWPFYRYENNQNQLTPLYRWWFWPLVAHTVTDRQDAWVWLWPLIWLRKFWDPEDVERQTFVVPFFWNTVRETDDGGRSDFYKLWPIVHGKTSTSGAGERRGDWNLLSPWPWHEGNAYGVDEAYGWLWTLVKGRRRATDDESIEFTANVFTTRTRGDVTQSSVPLLFNYEGDRDGGTLRLFQFLPIPWWGTSAATDDAR